MASTSETGHAKNLAHFQQLLTFCKSYGATYNPSRQVLQIQNLEKLLAQAQAVLNNVKSTKAAFDNATNNRKEGFNELKKTSLQVVSAFAASGVPQLAVADAKGHLRKMNGRRAKEIKPAVAPPATGALPSVPMAVLTEATQEKHISVSQLSFDNMADHFSKLVQTVSQQPAYNPNEQQFTAAGLQLQLDKLNNLNTTVVSNFTDWNSARISRNDTMYNPLTGLVQVSLDVKQYVRSIFGNTSPQFKQVSGLRIVAMK